jgi:phytoene synthase
MDPDDYCRSHAAPPASSLHYALLFLDDARRSAITALAAFVRELAKASRDTSDAGVAAAQLAWWRIELGQLTAGTPQHPVTRSLARHAVAFPILTEGVEDLLDAAAEDLARPRHVTFASLAAHCDAWGGTAAALSARVIRAQDDALEVQARRIGGVLRLGEILRDVGVDARRNRIYLPQEDMARYGVTAAEILQRRPGEGFAPLMSFQTARHAQLRREAIAPLSRDARHALRPALILARLQAALLHEIERDRFAVLEQRASLTPIRKLWIAWRTYSNPSLG